MLANYGPLEAMAVDEAYDELTKYKLRRLLRGKLEALQDKRLSEIIKGENIAEIMSGVGRLVPVYD